MENKDNNLDETKVFKAIDAIDDDSETNEDTLHIPTFNKIKAQPIDETLEMDTVDVSDELIDKSLENLKAAEEEINQMLAQQNGSGDDDSDMAKKKKKKMPGIKKFNIFLLIITMLMLVGFIGAGSVWMYLIKDLPELDINALNNENSAILLDVNGEEFFDVGMYTTGEIFDDIEYGNMSQNIVDAFVSIEDSRFFKHNGFDLSRFTKAMMINVKDTIKNRRLSFSQGGSTLTMQLLKTSQFSADKELARKAMEITLAFELNDKMSKDDVFQYYVNKINYGAGNSRGLESAAQYYFGKSAAELNISESALLAGVVNQPNSFSPIKNLDAAYKRRNEVIDLMEYHGYIDAEEARLAKAIKIENQLTDDLMDSVIEDSNPYLDYVNAVIEEVEATLGIDALTTPLTIQTNMDPKVQQDINRIQKEETYRYPDDIMQSAIAIVDNDTGAIAGLGGGRQNSVFLGFNRATRMFQQPGSVTKPLLSYALAFEHLGYSTSHVVEDKPVQYAGTDKVLKNANGRYQGQVRLKDAVANSLNTPAYLTLLDVEAAIGQNAVAAYLKDSLGFSRVRPPGVDENGKQGYNTQYAIGGSTFEVTPLELAAAQAVMMNGGNYIKPRTVQYVETVDNVIMKDEFASPKVKVVSEETAYLVSVLENYNVNSGVINRMEVLAGKPYPVYAKTGTTDYAKNGLKFGIPEGAGKDQWMMASSRKYTSVVWMGWDYDDLRADAYWTNAKYNANPLGKMQLLLLDSIHAGKENPGKVERPEGVADISHVLATYPYANPVPNMDTKYITSGEINRKFLKLIDLDAASVSLEPLKSFTAEAKASSGKEKTITINWAEYPADGSVAGATYDISLGGIKATGTRLFDPSWIFGEIRYEAIVYIDGVEFDQITSDSNTNTQNYIIDNKSTIKVCGYYANSAQRGPESCVEVKNPEIEELYTFPKFNTESDVEYFIAQHSLSRGNFKKEFVTTDDKTLDNYISSITYYGVDVTGQTYKVSSLKKMPFVVTYYKFEESNETPGGEE